MLKESNNQNTESWSKVRNEMGTLYVNYILFYLHLYTTGFPFGLFPIGLREIEIWPSDSELRTYFDPRTWDFRNVTEDGSNYNRNVQCFYYFNLNV